MHPSLFGGRDSSALPRRTSPMFGCPRPAKRGARVLLPDSLQPTTLGALPPDRQKRNLVEDRLVAVVQHNRDLRNGYMHFWPRQCRELFLFKQGREQSLDVLPQAASSLCDLPLSHRSVDGRQCTLQQDGTGDHRDGRHLAQKRQPCAMCQQGRQKKQAKCLRE